MLFEKLVFPLRCKCPPVTGNPSNAFAPREKWGGRTNAVGTSRTSGPTQTHGLASVAVILTYKYIC